MSKAGGTGLEPTTSGLMATSEIATVGDDRLAIAPFMWLFELMTGLPAEVGSLIARMRSRYITLSWAWSAPNGASVRVRLTR